MPSFQNANACFRIPLARIQRIVNYDSLEALIALACNDLPSVPEWRHWNTQWRVIRILAAIMSSYCSIVALGHLFFIHYKQTCHLLRHCIEFEKRYSISEITHSMNVTFFKKQSELFKALDYLRGACEMLLPLQAHFGLKGLTGVDPLRTIAPSGSMSAI